MKFPAAHLLRRRTWLPLQQIAYSNMTMTSTSISVLGKSYPTDHITNITPRIMSKLGKNLYNLQHHPLWIVRQRIQNYFYKSFPRHTSSTSPLFSVYDNLSPVTTVEQNFDSLLFPDDHPGRNFRESYYINCEYMLRAHTSAHQHDLIKSGLNAFLVFGDVYRRDQIDSTHLPVFHHVEGVRLFNKHELFKDVLDKDGLGLFEDGRKTTMKQACHALEASKLVEHDLKKVLENLAVHLFGTDIEMRWVDQYFPFTHPSWELEIRYQEEWLEVLGCGVIEQQILANAGAGQNVGWAFGLGLDRLAMKLFSIPDIRILWSEDSGVLSQFKVDDIYTPITFMPVSQYPQCINDISFWLPDSYCENDFYDLVRNVGGDLVEQVNMIDNFYHPKHQRHSHCYRIIYRHMDRTLTQEEVNDVHRQLEDEASNKLGVEIR